MRQTSVFRFVRSSAGAGRGVLADLDGHLDVRAAAELWTAALTTPWDGTVHWFHGDLAPGNLLIREGCLASVVDFGTCGIGHPACDLAAAWSLLTRAAGICFATDSSSTTQHGSAAEDQAHARRVLAEILNDAT